MPRLIPTSQLCARACTLALALVTASGIAFAQGLLHDSFGLTTYVLGTLAMIGVARLLR